MANAVILLRRHRSDENKYLNSRVIDSSFNSILQEHLVDDLSQCIFVDSGETKMKPIDQKLAQSMKRLNNTS